LQTHGPTDTSTDDKGRLKLAEREPISEKNAGLETGYHIAEHCLCRIKNFTDKRPLELLSHPMR